MLGASDPTPQEGETDGKDRLARHLARRGHAVAGPQGRPLQVQGLGRGLRLQLRGRVGLEQAQNSEALLLGRVTYEAMQAFWPTAEGQLCRQAERVAEVRRRRSRTRPGTRPSWATTGRRKRPDCERARRRDPRLWQPPPLAGTDRDGAGGRYAYWSTRWCSVPEIAFSTRCRTRSRCAWSNRVRLGEAW